MRVPPAARIADGVGIQLAELLGDAIVNGVAFDLGQVASHLRFAAQPVQFRGRLGLGNLDEVIELAHLDLWLEFTRLGWVPCQT